jgi:Fe2+ or Zn2+ uptake regulation protein
MSVDNDGTDVCLVCEECGDTSRAFHRSDFNALIDFAKRKGWKIENRRGQYFHCCPDCCSELAEFGLDED